MASSDSIADMTVNRRTAMATALSIGVMPSALKSLGRSRARDDSDVLDVLVVGGGVSGCYTAWRLAKANPKARIEVFERSDRIGGRLWSVKPEGMTNQVAELGGMRIASNQYPLINLVSELGLKTDPYPATQPQDIYFLRGIRSRASELVASKKYGYRVRKDLEGKTMDDLFNMVIQEATGKTEWNREELQSVFTKVRFKGELLHKLPYRWVFEEVLGHEGTKMLLESMGYGRPNTNAAVFLEEAVLDLFIDGYSHVRGGYQKVPLSLAEQAGKLGVGFNFKHEMLDLEFDGDLNVVSFRASDGSTRSVKAKKVVMTIPLSAYRFLPNSCPLRGDNGLRKLAASLQDVPATKIYVNFPSQWWTSLGIKSGRSISDLPIRQVFYLPDESGRGLTLSPYASGANESGFWSPLLPGDKHRLSGDSMVAKTIVQQISTMHGIDIPEPSEILYRSFNGGYEGNGWNMWRPGCEPWLVAPAARQPIPGRGVYCVGQATAQVQGWVMDTIASAETVLRSEFRLDRPHWWPASYIPD